MAIFGNFLEYLNILFSGPKPVGKDQFSDILDAQGFKTSTTTPENQKNTLKDLLRQQEQDDGVDPIKQKVRRC